MSKSLFQSVLVLCACAAGILGCQGEFGTISSAHLPADGGPPPHDAGRDAGPPGTDAGPPEGCTLTQGYWKTHPEAWPVTSLMIGGRTYTQAELIALMELPTAGDASLSLVQQLVAAELNVLSGATGTPAIAEAQAWFDAHDDAMPIPLGIHPKTVAGQEAVALVNELTDYNEGNAGPPHCD